jgi:hypothetical protein
MPTSPIPPLTDAELAALEAEAVGAEDFGLMADLMTFAAMASLLAEVRAAREAAKRHDLEARRRIAELESMLGPRS